MESNEKNRPKSSLEEGLNTVTLEIIMIIVWICLTVYGSWFLFRAKTYQPLNFDNLALQWKLHKQKTGCQAKLLQSLIKNNNEVIGFKCDCGYEFKQKRLITQRINKPKMEKQK